MKRTYSLRRNVQFQSVYRRGKSCSNPTLVLLYLRRNDLKVGISVSKKVGKAVTRNRIKRRLRECVHPLLSSLTAGHYVLVARAPAATASFQALNQALLSLLKRQKLLKEAPPKLPPADAQAPAAKAAQPPSET